MLEESWDRVTEERIRILQRTVAYASALALERLDRDLARGPEG